MQAMSVIRNWQIDMMNKNIDVLKQILTSVDQEAFGKRDAGDGWTIAEVLGHLLEAERGFYERAKLTIDTDNPQLPYSDPAQVVIEKGYASKDAMALYEEWVTARQAYIAYLQSLPEDDDLWERPAQHPRRGRFTIHDQLFLAAWHDVNHIEQIVKIIHYAA